MDSIRDRYNEVWAEVGAACRRSERDPDGVRIVAVTKTQPVEILQAAREQGITVFGENRVQELLQKQTALSPGIEWHLIGTLQRNKAKFVVGRAALIHSVDSAKLARTISMEALATGVTQDVLLQINIAEEPSKHGFSAEDILTEIKEISALKGIKVKGLMTMAPYTDEPESVRFVFKKLKDLSKRIAELHLPGIEMRELSMGMSNDFAVAVEEGATLIRVGSRIFGERNYKEEK
ncbi:MAG: YggS family pyridoxal phosphate-dependent enzyme [Clostridia bacterium]|jgi:pyridoxal phosphate enzyme (YggS family)|nr:YggS family pyridoxal phosphate-dependent enzyme [Clostridia bacterium]